MNFLVRSPHKDLLNREVTFAQTDSEESYKRNVKTYGNDWYYSNHPVTYKFNKLGYRMKELEQVDYENYYAFFGCSFTVGIGLNVEDTFAYKISQQANVDYINAAIGGSSVDFVYYNFINLMTSAPNKPKIVFINWPNIYRTFYWLNNNVQFMLPSLIIDGHWKRSYEDFIVMDNQVFTRFDTIRKSIKLICELANIPMFEMSTSQDNDHKAFSNRYPDIVTNIPLFIEDMADIKNIHFSRARDINKTSNGTMSHPGLSHQNAIVSKFFEVMK